jgi:putative flippase GtrA
MIEMMRFFIVSVGGVVVDIAISYAVAFYLGAPLWLAAAVGFSVAAVVNYFFHEVWTFRQEDSPVLSSRRALYYFVSSGVTLLARLTVVAWFSAWISRDHALEILIGGAAVSFFVNYVVSKFLIFPKRTEKEGIF